MNTRKGTIRIIGGALKNKRLKTPFGLFVRPTSEKVREALFDMLGNTVEGTRFLDLFAGTGAVGIEAASRGASKVTFVESKKMVVRILQTNIGICQLETMSTIIHFDAIGSIRTLNNRQLFHDIIFLDPPYNSDLLISCLRLFSKYPIMEARSTIVTQSFFKTRIPEVKNLTMTRRERYGDTVLSFFRWEGA